MRRKQQEMPDMIALHGSIYDAAFPAGNVSNIPVEDPGSAYDQFRVGVGLLASMSNERKIDFVQKATGMPDGLAKAEVLNLVIGHHENFEEPQLRSLAAAAVHIAEFKGKYKGDPLRYAQCNAQLAISTALKSTTFTDEFKEGLVSSKSKFKTTEQDKAAYVQQLRTFHEGRVSNNRTSVSSKSLSKTEMLSKQFQDANVQYGADHMHDFAPENRSSYLNTIASIADDVSGYMQQLSVRESIGADRSRQRDVVR